MSSMLKDIEYKGIFQIFEEISAIPRGSRNNKQISDYLVSFAEKHGLNYKQDEVLNVIITKEATSGYEECPTVIIQGHMDMVCEKDSNIDHDFLTQGLELVVKDDFISANGTTLGGDDGIAIAYALAILSSDEIKHPRIEAIFTTDEEIGMDGAIGLDTTELRGKYMFNIDSEEEGILLSSAAGGLTATAKLPLEYSKETGIKVSIAIKGLLGGHSGSEIDKNRTNATLLMGRLLFELEKDIVFHAIDLCGGGKDNAIPRESSCTLLIQESDKARFEGALKEQIDHYKKELATSEPHLEIDYHVGDKSEENVITAESMVQILHMILFAPNGIQTMSADIKGLVESSLNLGIFHIEKNQAVFGYAVRSSVDSYKQFMSKKLETLITKLGGAYSTSGEYPAWEYKKDSKLRELSVRVYEEMYGKKPEIQAIHAGLECGIIASKLDGIDIISLGPDMFDVHTPKERLNITSTKRVYDYVLKVLEEFKGIKE
ncbi:aminoacyl-histidine dipeptidase [Anaeromicropila herbilytica]|uniref:Cytosol non-specific dipeptidase n=1 Tax=Anaeromicropila herbilytica TaxID=2785025 RepID=A0A7R7EKQ7_9FIRM|nr:aminoacyl-histidine dipeptidase [Anaeromicropila herbilytica]BCN30539.1 aminoacyl-histidine dipeptidase [Anaeromicropila herbilytica]